MMGTPASELGGVSATKIRDTRSLLASQFAVGQYEVKFDEWDTCIIDGGCNGYKPPDQGWGGASDR